MAGKIPPQFLANIKKRQAAAGQGGSGSAAQDDTPNKNPFGGKPNPFAKKATGSKTALTAAQKKAARKRALQNLQNSKKG